MLPTLSREAIQMCTLKPIIISNHKWPLSHFLKHFIRRVHRFHSRVNIVKSCMSFEWTLMNSLESALKCSKVFHVFCALYQWSNQKVLCPELRVRHASSLMKIPKCYNVYCLFCLFVFIVTRTTSSTTPVLSYMASSRFSHKDKSLGTFFNKCAIYSLSVLSLEENADDFISSLPPLSSDPLNEIQSSKVTKVA